MTKKIAPTQSYLDMLESDLDVATLAFEQAKRSLYQHTATAKIGEAAFENARKACLETNAKKEKILVLIAKVRKELGK